MGPTQRSHVPHDDSESPMWRRGFLNHPNDKERSVGGRGSGEIYTRDNEIGGFGGMRAPRTMTGEEYLERSFSPTAMNKTLKNNSDNEKKMTPSRGMYPRGNAIDPNHRTCFQKKNIDENVEAHIPLSQSTLTTVESVELGLTGSCRLNSNRYLSDDDLEPSSSTSGFRQHYNEPELKMSNDHSMTPTSQIDMQYGNLGVGVPVDDDTVDADSNNTIFADGSEEAAEAVVLAPPRDQAQVSVSRHVQIAKQRYKLKTKGYSNEKLKLELAAEPTDFEERILTRTSSARDASEIRDFQRANIPLHRRWTILRKSGSRNEEVPQPERIAGTERDRIRHDRIEIADRDGHSLNTTYLSSESQSRPPCSVPGFTDISSLTTTTRNDLPQNNNTSPSIMYEGDGRQRQPDAPSQDGTGTYYRNSGPNRINSELTDLERKQRKDRNRAMSFALVLSCLVLVVIAVVVVVLVGLPQLSREDQAGVSPAVETNVPSVGPPPDDSPPPPMAILTDLWTFRGDFYIFPQNDATRFGRSVSLDSSGSTVAIASLNTVIVKQYSNITNAWTQIGPDFQGRRVSISGDGRTIAVQTSDTRLQVYFRSSDQTWKALGNAISIDSVRVQSLALSRNGLVLAVGGVGFNTLLERSRVYVYFLDQVSSLWMRIRGMEDTTAGVEVQVALSVDGTIVGTATRVEDAGTVAFKSFFHVVEANSFGTATVGEEAGSVSVGFNKAVLGSPGGRLTFYTFSTTGLVQKEQLFRVNTATTPQVAISTDGSVVAASWESNVEVWHRTDENWVSRGWWKENSGLNVTSISLASDGQSIAIGVAGENTAGFVAVFAYAGNDL